MLVWHKYFAKSKSMLHSPACYLNKYEERLKPWTSGELKMIHYSLMIKFWHARTDECHKLNLQMDHKELKTTWRSPLTWWNFEQHVSQPVQQDMLPVIKLQSLLIESPLSFFNIYDEKCKRRGTNWRTTNMNREHDIKKPESLKQRERWLSRSICQHKVQFHHQPLLENEWECFIKIWRKRC